MNNPVRAFESQGQLSDLSAAKARRKRVVGIAPDLDRSFGILPNKQGAGIRTIHGACCDAFHIPAAFKTEENGLKRVTIGLSQEGAVRFLGSPFPNNKYHGGVLLSPRLRGFFQLST
jgi:hypothetical protein